jgi:hypothetical protein
MEPAHLFNITVDMWPIPFEINSYLFENPFLHFHEWIGGKWDIGPLKPAILRGSPTCASKLMLGCPQNLRSIYDMGWMGGLWGQDTHIDPK